MSVTLLAFGFATPALLGWLALAATPLLIHWLFRRRFREVPWAAMQFLYEAARKQSRRSRLEQLLLLATRMLILIVVVLALARPHFADQDLLARPSPPTLRLLVMDCSLSMGRLAASSDEVSSANLLETQAANRSKKTVFDSAKQTAKEIVQRGQAGDRYLLVRVAGSEPRVLIQQPTANVNSVLDEIDRTKLTFERGDVAATLRLLPELISRKRPDERCELVVISDFQSDNWSGVLSDQVNVGSNAELAALWKQLSEEQSLSLMEVGPSAAENATIASLRIDSPLLAAGQQTLVTATIRNTGSAPLTQQRIDWLLDGQPIGTRFIDLPLGQEESVATEFSAPASGEHVLEMRIANDALAADNTRWLPISVRSELRVALVNGRATGRPRDAATFFVEQALAPALSLATKASRGVASAWLRTQTVTEPDLTQLDLTAHDVLFLCDVHDLSDVDVERLRKFVEKGGGLIVSLGPSHKKERLNESLFGPHGVMPIRLLDPISMSASASDAVPSPFGFDLTDDLHPLLREFRGNPGAGLGAALIRQYVHAEVLPPNAAQTSAPVEIALRYSSGDPAILSQSRGAGRCVVLTSAVDESWGEWPIWAPGFVPLMHELVSFAASSDSANERLIGEPFVLSFVDESDGSMTLIRPNGERQTLAIQAAQGDSAIVIRDTTQPGIYEIGRESGTSRRRRFAINIDSRECEPSRLRAADLASSSRSSDRKVAANAASAQFAQAGETSSADNLSRQLLFVVIALLVIEQCLAWKFSVGIVAALLVLLGVGIHFVTQSESSITICLMVCVLAGCLWFAFRWYSWPATRIR